MKIIKYSCYKPAPESARVSVNGRRLDISDTMIPTMIACGQHNKAIEEIKRTYRKQNACENKYIYCFFRENSKQFYYIACLSFPASADLETRLQCYKELKHHLQTHPQTITTESGHITPTGSTTPTVKTEQIKIDFFKCRKIKIA